MSEHRDEIVRRVVHALDDEQLPSSLVWEYFDAERDVVVDAARETLAATGDHRDIGQIAETVDRELIDGLRFPPTPASGLLPTLYVRRGRVATGLMLLVLVLAALLL